MIELKPELYKNFVCPECNSKDVNIIDALFPGLHIVADCICNFCGFKFLHDFPIGHSLFYPSVIGKENFKDYSKPKYDWFHKVFYEAYKNQNNRPVNVEKKVYKKTKNVLILNCIDYLYGHVLLKLFNAQYYLEQFLSLGLIVIIPKNFEWLVPEGISEVWLVDIKLSEARDWFVSIDCYIKNELQRFEKVFLSLAYSHPDFSKIDISKFAKAEKFNLDNFTKEHVTITFISREDRFWVSSKFELYFYQIFCKFKLLPFTKFYFAFKQNRKISTLYNNIKKKIPGIKFYVVGIGSSGKFPSSIEDNRTNVITDNTELEWCNIYSKSHIVIGIHGSNMILPSALAAGIIEILPESRLGNITEDIAAYYPGIILLYLCRFVYEFSTPKEISANIISLINSFDYFIINNDRDKCKKVLSSGLKTL